MYKKITLIMMIFLATQLYSATDVKGYINQNTTWAVSGSPYNIIGNITVRNGAVLTIESGVQVKFKGNYNLYIGYNSSSLGKLNADNVTFTGYKDSNGDEQIRFRYGSGGRINNCSFDNIQIFLDTSSPIITNNSFSNSDRAIVFYNECNPQVGDLSGNTFNNVDKPGISFYGTVDEDWTIRAYGYPLYLVGDLTVKNGATFTIWSGNHVTYHSYNDDILIGYSSSSLGTFNAENVTFTGYKDSNGDEQIRFRYGSGGRINNCSFDNIQIFLDTSSPIITNNSFSNSDRAIVFYNECNPQVGDLSGNTFNNVDKPGISFYGTVDEDWTIRAYGYPLYLVGDLTVKNGATFTIWSGNHVTYHSYNDDILIGYSSSSLGTFNAENVTFTGYKDSNGDEQIRFRYGSGGRINNCSFDNIQIFLDTSSPIITNNSFSNSDRAIVFYNECNPQVGDLSGNTFTNVDKPGISFYGTVDEDWTIRAYGYTLYLVGDLMVRNGATLTMEEGQTIKNKGNSNEIRVGYSSSSTGGIILNNVTFKSINRYSLIINYLFCFRWNWTFAKLYCKLKKQTERRHHVQFQTQVFSRAKGSHFTGTSGKSNSSLYHLRALSNPS
ncbi:hypothetical protein ACX8XN_05175 [Calditrichota bacterium GD2]